LYDEVRIAPIAIFARKVENVDVEGHWPLARRPPLVLPRRKILRSSFIAKGFAMLVLTRHAGEQIVIDGNIVVTVLSVKGSKVRFGITAPDSVRVDREEIHERRLSEAEPPQRRLVAMNA